MGCITGRKIVYGFLQKLGILQLWHIPWDGMGVPYFETNECFVKCAGGGIPKTIQEYARRLLFKEIFDSFLTIAAKSMKSEASLQHLNFT